MATPTIIGINRHYAAIIGCATAFTAGAVVSLAGRVISKIITHAPLGWEDYTIYLATAIYVVTAGLMIKGVTVGRHSTKLNDPDDMFLTKMVYIYSEFYFAVIALCIASILFLYRRVFIKPFVRHATTVLLVITVCWWIPCMIVETGYFGALPETFHGDPENTTPFHLSYLNWWLSVGIIEQVIIIVAIFLPIRETYQLQLNMQKKIAMVTVFAVSYICVGTGIARLATIYHPNKKDLDISIGDIWVMCHLGTAIISANLPVCWPVISRTGRILGISRGARSYEQDSDRAGSTVGDVLEAATVGPKTKEGYTRNEKVAGEMGHKTGRASPSPSPSGNSGGFDESSSDRNVLDKQQGPPTRATRQDAKGARRRWLELRPFNWRMSISGSMFASQRSMK